MRTISVPERIYTILGDKKMNQKELAVILEVSPGAINKLVNENGGLSKSMVSKICYKWPDYSRDWLTYGIGNRFVDDDASDAQEPKSNYGLHTAGRIKELEGRVEQLESALAMLLNDLALAIEKMPNVGVLSIDFSKYDQLRSR